MGADGVLVAGCHIGDCHYIKGNYMTLKRMAFFRRLLDFAGYDPERLRLEWISAAEGGKYAEVVRDFTETIRKLGPLKGLQAVPARAPMKRVSSVEIRLGR